jgi:two-component system, NtrC family, nitrogen regulation sensor histidine kinase NtrY
MSLKSRINVQLLLFVVLLLAGLITAYFSLQPESLGTVANNVSKRLEIQLTRLKAESALIEQLVDSPTVYTREKSTLFYIYENDSLSFWSSNKYIPETQSVTDTFDVKLLRTGGESYISYKRVLDVDRFIVCLLPLRKEYSIKNDYLETEWNPLVFESPNIVVLDNSSTRGLPVCFGNDCIFRIAFAQDDSSSHPKGRMIASALVLGSIIVLIVILYSVAEVIRGRYGVETAFIFLVASFFALRWLMIGFNFPNELVGTDLFDPQIFAVSSLNSSLGDFLVNIVAITALCFFIFKNFYKSTFLRLHESRGLWWLILIASAICILFAGLFPFVVIQTLYNNSEIVLDISQSLAVEGLRLIAFIVVILSGIASFLFSHAFIQILTSEKSKPRIFGALAVAIVIFVLINFATEQKFASSLISTLLYFVAVYLLKLNSKLKRLSYYTFAYLFISIFVLSMNGAYAIYHFSQKEKIENQFRFANTFLIDRDYFGEYLLHEASLKIASDVFTQTRIASPFLSKEAIGQKIRQYFLPSYFNKYDVDIIIFNAIGEPVEGNRTGSFTELMYDYDQHAYRTDRGIYYVDSPEEDVTQKYALVVPIKKQTMISGYVVVELSLKRIIPENVYPELLVDHSFQQFYRTQDLNYAVFSNRNILFTSGEFNYESRFDRSWLGNPQLYTTGISAADYDHIAQDDQSSRVAVVSTESLPLNYGIANFSFLFVLGLLVILILLFVQGVYNYMRGKRLFFSARIQLYLNLAFFVPLIIVSISTLGLTTRSSHEQLGSEYLSKSRVFGEQITSTLSDFLFRNTENQLSFNNRLSELTTLSNLDANVYTPDGALLATSQPLIFESGLITKYINPEAFEKIRIGENAFIESEQIGNLEYFVAYSSLKSTQTGKLIGILAIPFFQSGYYLEKVQIIILTNILNIFAFIFIILLVLSYFVSERLTFPLRFITQSLRKTSLTNANTPLTWTANDEIGMMVKEYNSMLFKLSESKSELEQTQREKAWREIAQQVAHEIKNPLTPMKLTLQQLERSMQSGRESSSEKLKMAVTALLSQVDTLNEIASSFSGFAKMPEPVIKKLELLSIVRRSIDLHTPTGEIDFKSPVKEVFVMADEQILSRTFSNIILNALQSARPGQAIRVAVTVERTGSHVRIKFQDNGKGIEPEIADRVFIPHFSTKKSGSGLGLAIAKQGIEQMHGRIWFETHLKVGTSFYIELPIISHQ